MGDLFENLKKLIEGDLTTDLEERILKSRDASIFEIVPECVVYPKHEKDVQTIVRFVSENKHTHPELSIVVRSAGTCMSGGALGSSIIVDVSKYMFGTLSIKTKEMGGVATVLPGTYYRDFDKETKKQGLIMPTYTASRELCTVGGMVANNAGGEKSLHYGKTEDFVEHLRVVLRDGNVYEIQNLTVLELEQAKKRPGIEGEMYTSLWNLIQNNVTEIEAAKPDVSKNSAGYYLWNVYDKNNQTFNLCHLFAGSQGTFGIITEITFRLVAVKKASKLVVIFLNDLSYIGELINDLLSFNPESIESYDDNTLKVAVKFFRDFLKKRGVFGMITFMFSFLPEFFMMLSGGIPKIILLVECAGNTEAEIDKQAIRMKKKIRAKYHGRRIHIHVTQNDKEEQKYWEVRHDSFNLLRKHSHGVRTAPFIDDFIVRPEHLPTFIPELNAILNTYDIQYTIAGHPGDGNFHIIPLMDFKLPQTKEIIYELSDKVYDLVAQYHGSITAEHNDGIIRTPYLGKMYSAHILSLFKQVKDLFDPENIFNPLKKVGATREDIKKYFIKDGESA
ncbi:MAG: FAD-binding oxidoreductase [Candidatus Pacebacteria bacterium]|nr:FAD-binding oxidoreductase [Candidatus Paceibacterota bacterium]